MSLLVTTGTSGAAEVFAAALEGNKRADLIGEHTLGRAGLQKLVKLPENRGMWLTYARYLTPDGKPIHGKGLEPTVQVDEPDVEFGAPAPDDRSGPRCGRRARQNQTARPELPRCAVCFAIVAAVC